MLGNGDAALAAEIVEGDLIATVSTPEAVKALAHATAAAHAPRAPAVHIKVDSGMGRNGVCPTRLRHLVDDCAKHGVHVEVGTAVACLWQC